MGQFSWITCDTKEQVINNEMKYPIKIARLKNSVYVGAVRPTATLIKDGKKKSYISDIPEVMEELNNRCKNNQR